MSKLSERVDELERKVALASRQTIRVVNPWPIGKVVSVTGVYRHSCFISIYDRSEPEDEEIELTGTLRSAKQNKDELIVVVGGVELRKARFA